MNLEEKIKIIEEKIHNLPQEFDVEENHIILNNPRLVNLIIGEILNKPHLCNDEVFSCLNDTIIEELITNHGRYVYTTFISNMLETQIVSVEELESMFNQADVSEEDKEKFRQQVIRAFKDKNISIDSFRQNQETVQAMMEYQRYDLVSQVTRCRLDDDYAEEFWHTFPFDQYPFPPFLAQNQNITNKYIDKFPIKDVISAYIDHIVYTTFGTQEERKQALSEIGLYLDTLLEKLPKEETLDLSYLYEESRFFHDMVQDPEKKKIDSEICKKMNSVAILLFRHGLYDIMSDLFRNNLITKEEVREVIVKVAKTGDPANFKRINFIYIVEKFEDDIELADLLLENGLVEEATSLAFRYVKEKTDYILEQLKTSNEKYRAFAKTVTYNGHDEYELCKAKLESGFAEKIVISGYYYSYSPEELEEIKNILTTYPNIEFSCKGINQNEFIQIVPTLKNTSRINCIVEMLAEFSEVELPKVIGEINQDNSISNFIRKNFAKGLRLFQDNPTGVLNTPELLDVYYENDVYINRILDQINHNETLSFFYTEENYNKLKGHLSKTYKYPLDKLDKLESILGPLIIRYIDNENIKAIIALQPEELDKFIALFPNQPFTMQELNGVYDSLKQYEFGKKQPKEIQIFPTLLHAIEDKDEIQIEELITKIAKELDEVFIKRFLKKYELPEEYIKGDKTNLVKLVIEKIKITTGDKQEKYRTILHEMTDYYISKKREQYRESYNMEDELGIPYELEEKSVERAAVKYIIENSASIKTRIVDEEASKNSPLEDWGWGPSHATIYFSFKDYLISELAKTGVSKEVATDTIEFYINKDKSECKNFKEVKVTIPKLIKIVEEIIEKVFDDNRINEYGINQRKIMDYIQQLDSKKGLKRIYQLKEENIIFEVLTQLNIEALKKGVLSNDEVYGSLLRTMQKRKLHLLPKCVSSILGTEHLNISKDLTNIAGFISYYGTIHESVKKNLEANGKSSDNIMLNITNILIYTEVYSGLSSVYSQILGNEDAKLIKANPGPNAASKKLADDGRLKEAVERTKKLYERQEVTVPPFEQDMSLKGDKKMRVVVGNFTHPSTLTHGERTGACMRIGGVGESLFEFALDNPNGFHIRFEDPKTNEYISRVTGFRNGNTVFLNELRESCNKDNYSNEDVVEACKKAAEMLIELSKDSSCPIENVVVHRAYATEQMKSPMVNLGVKDIKEGLPKFYTDVGSSAIILATTGKQGKFTPLNFDKSNVPTYMPAREKAKVAKSLQEASNRINRVNSVKRLLSGENYEYIEPYQFPNGLIYAIVSDDWYIYVDENGNIIKDIIDIDPRAKEELAEALIEVEKNLTQIQSENQEAKYGL